MTYPTPEQHMADIAAATLANLTNLHDDLGDLQHQLYMLSVWADNHDLGAHEEALETAAFHLGLLAPTNDPLALRAIAAWAQREGHPKEWTVLDAIRDLAAMLPIRGLDYGDEIDA